MGASDLSELETIRGLAAAPGLSADARRTAAWCIDRLPRLYADFRRGHDSRHGDEIQRLVDGILTVVAGAAGVREAVTAQLRAMHERLGIPALHFKPAKPAAARKRKAG